MANIKAAQIVGSQLQILFDDGSRQLLPYVSNSRFAGSAATSSDGDDTGTGPNDPATPDPTAPTDNGDGTVSTGGTISGGITAAMISAAVHSAGGSTSAMKKTPQGIADMFNDAIAHTYPKILTSKNRAATLVGECAQETDWYKTYKEYGGASDRYAPYYGRGFIQLTWESNYRQFGQWLKKLGKISDSETFVKNPDSVATDQWAAYTAIFYFTQVKWGGKNLFEISDTDSSPWSKESRAVNRGDPYASSPAWSEDVRARAINAVYAVTPAPDKLVTTTSPVTHTNPTTNTTTTTVPQPGAGSVQEKLSAFCQSYLGKLRYTEVQSLRMNIPGGWTDCSALQWWCYKQITGKYIGSWTGEQQKYGTVIVDVRGRNHWADFGKLVKGDLIFFNWDYYNPTFDHVAMYIGDGKICHHGGNPYMGPKISSLRGEIDYAAGGFRVRRYV